MNEEEAKKTIDEIRAAIRAELNYTYQQGVQHEHEKIKESIQEIYKCQLYCMGDLCEHEEPEARICVKCFYEAIMKNIN